MAAQAVERARPAGVGRVAGADDAAVLAVAAGIRVDVDLEMPVAGQRGGQVGAHPRPRAQLADLGEPVRVGHRERDRVHHAHAAHADDRGGERVVVLVQLPVRVLARERRRVGGAGRGLDPVHARVGGDEVERAHVVGQRAEREARPVRGGRDHARDRLGVVAAHLQQRPLALGQHLVELPDPHAGLDALERLAVPVGAQAVDRERPGQAVGLDEVALGERDVRPRVPGADGADRGAVAHRGRHDLLELVEPPGLVDAQRLDRLVARVVAPALALRVRDAHGATLRI